MRLRLGNKHHLRKSADRKAQIRKAFVPLTELICAFRSADFLKWCLFPKRNLTHNLFFYFQYSLVLIIGSAEALPILCVRYFRWERERERDTERDGKWRHQCRAKIGDEFTLSLAKNSHNWRWAYTFPCQKFTLLVSPFTLPISPFTERSPVWRWNSQWAHTLHCQKNFLPLCSPSFKWHEPRDEWSKTQDKWSNPAQSHVVLPMEKLNQINTKNYWK